MIRREKTTLGDFLLPIKSVNPESIYGDTDFLYLDIASVNREEKKVESPQTIAGSSAPSRARQLVALNDVIVSTVRPNLNTVAVITESEASGIASTGFCVLRANPECLFHRYLFHWIASTTTVEYLVSVATGASYPAVSDRIIKGMLFSPPSLPEQERIVAILDKADSVRRKRQHAIKLADEFLRAVFLEMFGDPVINPKGFTRRFINEFYVDEKNGTKCGPFGSALKKDEYRESGIPVWNMDNISLVGDFFDDPKLWVAEEKFNDLASYSVINGDVIISRAGTVGKMGVVRTKHEKSLLSTNLIRVRFNSKLKPEFFVALMTYCKGRVGRLKVGPDGAFTHMNTGIIDSIEFPYPPVDLQEKFLAIVNRTKTQILKNVVFQNKIDETHSAISQRAFSGQL